MHFDGKKMRQDETRWIGVAGKVLLECSTRGANPGFMKQQFRKTGRTTIEGYRVCLDLSKKAGEVLVALDQKFGSTENVGLIPFTLR